LTSYNAIMVTVRIAYEKMNLFISINITVAVNEYKKRRIAKEIEV